jgi:hypothetical protein
VRFVPISNDIMALAIGYRKLYKGSIQFLLMILKGLPKLKGAILNGK